MNMKPSPACYALVRQAEGTRLSAYRDGRGIWTCGTGHIIGVGPATTCTADEAEQWLEQDMAVAVAGVNRLVKSATQNQFDALVSFTFNEGVGHLASSSLLHFHNEGQFQRAAAEFGKWIYAAGEVEDGLVERRKAEERLYLGEAA